MLGRVLRLLVLDEEYVAIWGIRSYEPSVGKTSAGPSLN